MNTKNNSTPRRSARLSNPSVIPDAPISAPRAAASPSMDSMMEAIHASVSIVSSLAHASQEIQAASQVRHEVYDSAIAGLAERQASFQVTSESAIAGLAERQASFQVASESAIAGLAERQASFQADSRERHEASEAFQAASRERHEASEARHEAQEQEISNLKKQLTQSAQKQKQYEFFSKSHSHAEAARSMGGTTLFCAATRERREAIEAEIRANRSAIARLAHESRESQAAAREQHEAIEANIRANRSAIARLVHGSRESQDASRDCREANESEIAGLAESQARFQTISRELQADLAGLDSGHKASEAEH